MRQDQHQVTYQQCTAHCTTATSTDATNEIRNNHFRPRLRFRCNVTGSKLFNHSACMCTFSVTEAVGAEGLFVSIQKIILHFTHVLPRRSSQTEYSQMPNSQRFLPSPCHYQVIIHLLATAGACLRAAADWEQVSVVGNDPAVVYFAHHHS